MTLCAIRVLLLTRRGSPVFGLGSNPGAELEVTCTRRRLLWLKTMLVDHRSRLNSYTSPGFNSFSSLKESWNLARRQPSQTLNERPSGYTSQSRTKKSVSGASLDARNLARTRPVTSSGAGCACKHQHIVTIFDRTLILRPCWQRQLPAADGGDRVRGIIGEGERLRRARLSRRNRSVAMEIKGGVCDGQRRPMAGRAPGVARGIGLARVPHHVIRDGWLAFDAVVHPLQCMVEPSPLVADIVGRALPIRECQVAGLLGENSVGPWSHDKFLPTAGLGPAVFLVTDERVNGALGEDVKVSANMDGGRVDFVVALSQFPCPPIIVIVGVPGP